MSATLPLKMARACEPINADHRDIGPVVVCGTGYNVLTRNGLTPPECSEPFNVHQWMGVNPEMLWQLENDLNLHDMHNLQSNTCQCTLFSSKTPGTYHQAQPKKIVDILCPTQMLYQILQGIWPCDHERWPLAWHKSSARHCCVLWPC